MAITLSSTVVVGAAWTQWISGGTVSSYVLSTFGAGAFHDMEVIYTYIHTLCRVEKLLRNSLYIAQPTIAGK